MQHIAGNGLKTTHRRSSSTTNDIGSARHSRPNSRALLIQRGRSVMAAVDLNVLAADSLLMGTAALARKYGKSERWIRMLKSKPDFAEARARAAA